MKTFKRVMFGLGLLTILLALMSLTVFNRHFRTTRLSHVMREGRIAMERQDYGEAYEAYRYAIGLDRKNTEAYLFLSQALVYEDEIDEAIYYLKIGIKQTGSEALRTAHSELLGLRPPPPPPPPSPSPPPPPPSPSPTPEETPSPSPEEEPSPSPEEDPSPSPEETPGVNGEGGDPGGTDDPGGEEAGNPSTSPEGFVEEG